MAGMNIPCPSCSTLISVPNPIAIDKRFSTSTLILASLVIVLCVALAVTITSLFFLNRQRPNSAVSSANTTVTTAQLTQTFRENHEEERRRREESARREDEAKIHMRDLTLKAWNALQAADNTIRQSKFDTWNQKYSQIVFLYSQVDLTGVDPVLQEHFRDSISVNKIIAQKLAPIDAEYKNIQTNTELATGAGAVIGAAASDGSNPQGAAAGGAILLGLLGIAVGEVQRQDIQEKNKSLFDECKRECGRINARDVEVADILSKKYGTVFTDAF
jgi:hypothetical protein